MDSIAAHFTADSAIEEYPGRLSHLGEYTRVLKKHLPRHCFEPVPSRLLWMLPHLAVVAAAAWSIVAYSLPWLVDLGLSFLIGGSFACLGFLGHEILHGSVVKTPWLRNLAGQVCLWPFAVGPRMWRRWHNVEHHGHTQHAEDDPDAMHTLEDLHERPGLLLIYRIAPWLRAILMFVSFSFWFS
ncbi:MAG TPA: fatty acid desaturase, partial [Bacillota bacterium]